MTSGEKTILIPFGYQLAFRSKGPEIRFGVQSPQRRTHYAVPMSRAVPTGMDGRESPCVGQGFANSRGSAWKETLGFVQDFV